MNPTKHNEQAFQNQITNGIQKHYPDAKVQWTLDESEGMTPHLSIRIRLVRERIYELDYHFLVTILQPHSMIYIADSFVRDAIEQLDTKIANYGRL